MAHQTRSRIGLRNRLGLGRTNVVLRFNPDGVELTRVRSNRRWMPVWHIIFFIYMGLLIRLVVMADLGPAGYDQRMAALKNGNFIERAAAKVMDMDPVSRALAIKLRKGMAKVTAVFERDVWDGGV